MKQKDELIKKSEMIKILDDVRFTVDRKAERLKGLKGIQEMDPGDVYINLAETVERFVEAGSSLEKDQILYMLNRVPKYRKPTIEPKPEYIDNSLIIKHYSNGMVAMNEECFKRLDSQQITGKLNNPGDSLLTADSEACKEQKSKLDLISRADAIEVTWQEPTYTDPLNVLTEVRDRIEAIPSAQPKRGEWIYDAEAYPLGNPHGHYDCDQCGESVPSRTNFCPNCGADMRGGEDE